MSTDGHRTKWRRNIAENSNRLSKVHELYRQTSDDIANVNVSSLKTKHFAHAVYGFKILLLRHCASKRALEYAVFRRKKLKNFLWKRISLPHAHPHLYANLKISLDNAHEYIPRSKNPGFVYKKFDFFFLFFCINAEK